MTAYAVGEGVDLVLGAGGDGTIRVICSGLAGTGIPFGLIPAGTGSMVADIRAVARRRDALILQQKQAESAVDPIEELSPAAE